MRPPIDLTSVGYGIMRYCVTKQAKKKLFAILGLLPIGTKMICAFRFHNLFGVVFHLTLQLSLAGRSELLIGDTVIASPRTTVVD